MEYSKSCKVVLMVVVVTAAIMVGAEAAISCQTVSGYMSSCVQYLEGTDDALASGSCCDGVKSLYSATKSSQADRVTACNCMKSLASALGDKLKASNVGSLASECGVILGYEPSANIDCKSIP